MPLLPGDELPPGEIMMEHFNPDISLIHQMMERIDAIEQHVGELHVQIDRIRLRHKIEDQKCQP